MAKPPKRFVSPSARRLHKTARERHAAGKLSHIDMLAIDALCFTDRGADAARYLSPALRSIHESAEDLHATGAIDDDRMAEFDRKCLVPHRVALTGRIRTKVREAVRKAAEAQA